MGFLGFLLLGLIAGAIAKAIIPGDQPGGWFATLILGVIGAMVGGWLGGLIFKVDVMQDFWSLSAWIMAIVGSIIVLLIYGALTGRKR
ncbi:GlsB/YeaQ/YmgE family stress response membrane protein [Actinomyces polynesiensis]|uniref:GlsB/YeaQ/YmgE family stress response membrane protein n=1 Tax=Actinomyces polynesiensis TaxID=1325934 RepID=UPI0005BE3DC9|nr:GlsB/YeaQ/YmgE family stress response membrane protein [Actinomyces polynesiensis]